MTNRAEYELKLGPAANLVPNAQTRLLLSQWAVVSGLLSPDRALVMRLPALMNLYEAAEPPVPTQEQMDAAEAIYRDIMGFTAEPEKPAGNAINHVATAEIIEIARLNHPVMMVGPAGCGKTTIGEHVAQALGLPFYITSTVFDTHELMGFVDGMGRYHTTAFRQAYEAGGVWVADEIDAWDAAALLAANSALAQGLVTFPDSPMPVRRHADFRMVATANTYGKGADRVYVGRNELDAASIDRYAVVEVDYDPALEMLLCGGNLKWLDRVRSIRTQVQDRKIRHVVSTRAITMGRSALAAGFRQARVEQIYVFKGMSHSDRDKIK